MSGVLSHHLWGLSVSVGSRVFLLGRFRGLIFSGSVQLSSERKCLKISIILPRALLQTNNGIFSLFSLPEKLMWWKPTTNFVALRCTFSRIVIYFFKCGVHITCPYSRYRLTKVMNNFLNRGPSKYKKVLRINPAAFTFFTFTEMCLSNFSNASRITPCSRTCSSSCSSSCRWRVYFSVCSDVSRPFGSPVYRFGRPNSGAQKRFFNFLFEDFF